MKRIFIMTLLFLILLAGCARAEGGSEAETVAEPAVESSSPGTDNTVDITLSFETNASGIVYAAWVEDSNGNLIESIYACNSLMKNRNGDFNGRGYLTGDPLPYFKTKNGWKASDSAWRYPEDVYSVDGVTGASPDSDTAVEISRTVKLGSVSGYRVCLDIDNSVNTNDYFQDRPAFTYKTDLINTGAPAGVYTLALDGWMGNDTRGNPWGQDPRRTIDDYELYKYMQGSEYLQYIIDRDGNYDNLVSTVTAMVE